MGHIEVSLNVYVKLAPFSASVFLVPITAYCNIVKRLLEIGSYLGASVFLIPHQGYLFVELIFRN
jgi:hypothetical protein